MGTKNIVKYTERRGPVSISVEIETPVGVGDTLKFYTADVVPRMCERICSTLPVEVQLKNTKAMCAAFLIKDTDTRHGYGFLGNNCVLVPPYMIGRVEAITVDRNESARHIDVECRPLYVIGFDVEYNDGEIPKHLARLQISHAFVNKHVKNVIVLAASTKAMERECLLVVDERCVILLMKRTAAPQILLVEILYFQLLGDDKGIFITKFFLSFKNCIAINLQELSPP